MKDYTKNNFDIATRNSHIAIIAPPDRTNELISKAVYAGFTPINSVNGTVQISDLQVADCFYAEGFSNNRYLSELVFILYELKKPSISKMNFNIKHEPEYRMKIGNCQYSFFLFCPSCKKSITVGNIEVAPEGLRFKNWHCNNCKNDVEPIYSIINKTAN